MQDIQEDYYAVLGVEQAAPSEDIRKAYLKLAKRLHPDRFPNDPEKKAAAQQEFARVTRAHEVLGDKGQREEYDALRNLARSRAALDTGAPGATVASSAAPAEAAADAKPESKENWAAKHAGRAKDCYEKKRFQEAQTAIKEALRLEPNNVKYRCQLAEVYVALGWKTLAISEVQTALRIDPSCSEAKQMELKMKATQKAATDKKPGFLDSLSKLLGKK